MDNELFELCKEVYKRTSWQGIQTTFTLQWQEQHGLGDDAYLTWAAKLIHGNTPLYVTDYLLDKLPEGIMLQKEGNGYWSVMTNDQAEGTSWYEASAKSPLKALLKLTVALHEAGELK